MKALRLVGSLAFVAGLFFAVFAGIPWMGKAREMATQRMIANAAEIGADAVINMRYTTTSVVGSAAELLVYGTAVKIST